mgnify:CR=1 FL=1
MIRLGLWWTVSVLGTVIALISVIGTENALVIARAGGLVLSWVLPVVLVSLVIVSFWERLSND